MNHGSIYRIETMWVWVSVCMYVCMRVYKRVRETVRVCVRVCVYAKEYRHVNSCFIVLFLWVSTWRGRVWVEVVLCSKKFSSISEREREGYSFWLWNRFGNQTGLKTREFQTQLLHYFSNSDNKNNHHHTEYLYVLCPISNHHTYSRYIRFDTRFVWHKQFLHPINEECTQKNSLVRHYSNDKCPIIRGRPYFLEKNPYIPKDSPEFPSYHSNDMNSIFRQRVPCPVKRDLFSITRSRILYSVEGLICV